MTEREFVARLRRRFRFRGGIGIGDDAAVFPAGARNELITKDLLIEDVHFRREWFTMAELAEKSLAVNISDIAAMGGRPDHFYIGLGFPPQLGEAALQSFYDGLHRGCRRWRVDLAGGDFSRAGSLFISITVVGYAEHPVLRRGARCGDVVCVSGPLGDSALGLQLLLRGRADSYWAGKHKKVRPAVDLGAALAGRAHAMMDVSDGLLLDLQRLLEASGGKGARLEYERIPVNPRLRRTAAAHGLDEERLVLAGGEDYVLLFTLPPTAVPPLQAQGLHFFPIGVVTSGPELLVTRSGRSIALPSTGFDHFTTG